MFVILDTNILCQDYHFRTPEFKLLLEGMYLVNGTLAIPEVVVDEAVNRFREDLESAYEGMLCADRKLGKLVGDRRHNIHLVRDLQNETNIFKNRLLDMAISNGGIILPYPAIEHKNVVMRDLERKKPFKRDGSGYRDSLIWENVKNVVIEKNDYVAFITNNIKDFGEGPSIEKTYHSEMPNPEYITIYRSIKAFNDDLIRPKTKIIIELREALRDKEGNDFDIYAWFNNNLLDLINDYDLTRVITNTPDGIANVNIIGINDIDILGYNISEILQSQRYVSVGVNVNIQYTIRYNYEAIRFRNKHIKESDFNWLQDQISGVENNTDITIHLTFIYDCSTFTILSHFILPITGEFGSIESDGKYQPEEVV